MDDRLIISEIRTGSHLYGTSRPDSDEDYMGVFLPSVNELLGLQNCPTEWSMNEKRSAGPRNSKGDVDRKFYSIKRFFQLAAEGQPSHLEMLFAPFEMIMSAHPTLWPYILEHKHLFLSRKGVAPFIGFALAQAHKATIKGEHLNTIQAVVEWGKTLTPQQLNTPLHGIGAIIHDRLQIADQQLKMVTNNSGFTTVEIGARNFDLGVKTKLFLKSLATLEARYGTRSRAAAEQGYDYKSLSVAYRLLGQAKEFLAEGKITLPRPVEERELILAVKKGEFGPDHDYFGELTKQIDNLRQVVEPTSPLPAEPDWSRINELCIEILLQRMP